MTAAPYLLGRRGPGAAVVTGGGSGATDGGFVADPIVTTTASGNTTVKGQVKPGSFGKFVYPLATIAAGRQYTFRYTPQFSQLAQQGKLAMVGFGLKNNNDFHIVGLRGNGTTGLDKYQVNGTPPNGWNKQTGHTTSDGGASANGTQVGPNYIRLITSADGATYTFQTSPDNVTYTDEYTGQTPTPFSNVSGVLTFGIALWFNNADAGPFSIVIDQFADAAAPPSWHDFFAVSLTQNNADWNGYTVRQRVEAANISSPGGSHSRVTFQAASTTGMVLAAAYIGVGAPSGNAYAFASTPTQLTFGGANNTSCGAGGSVVSDSVAFAPQTGEPLVVSMYFNGPTDLKYQIGNTNYSSFYKSGANDPATVAATGYTNFASNICVNRVEGS